MVLHLFVVSIQKGTVFLCVDFVTCNLAEFTYYL